MKLTSIAQEQRFQIEVCLRLWAWNLCGLESAWVTVAVHIKIWQIWSEWGELEIPKQKCWISWTYILPCLPPCLQKNTQMEIKALAPNHSGRTGWRHSKTQFLVERLLSQRFLRWWNTYGCKIFLAMLRVDVQPPPTYVATTKSGWKVVCFCTVTMPLQTRGRWNRSTCDEWTKPCIEMLQMSCPSSTSKHPKVRCRWVSTLVAKLQEPFRIPGCCGNAAAAVWLRLDELYS